MAVKGNQKPTQVPMHKTMAANGLPKQAGSAQKPPFKQGK